MKTNEQILRKLIRESLRVLKEQDTPERKVAGGSWPGNLAGTFMIGTDAPYKKEGVGPGECTLAMAICGIENVPTKKIGDVEVHHLDDATWVALQGCIQGTKKSFDVWVTEAKSASLVAAATAQGGFSFGAGVPDLIDPQTSEEEATKKIEVKKPGIAKKDPRPELLMAAEGQDFMRKSQAVKQMALVINALGLTWDDLVGTGESISLSLNVTQLLEELGYSDIISFLDPKQDASPGTVWNALGFIGRGESVASVPKGSKGESAISRNVVVGNLITSLKNFLVDRNVAKAIESGRRKAGFAARAPTPEQKEINLEVGKIRSVLSNLQNSLGNNVFWQDPSLLKDKEKLFSMIMEKVPKQFTLFEAQYLGLVSPGGYQVVSTGTAGEAGSRFSSDSLELTDLTRGWRPRFKVNIQGVDVQFWLGESRIRRHRKLSTSIFVTPSQDVPGPVVQEINEINMRSIVRSILLEKLNKSDKDEIKKLAKQQAKAYFDAEIDKALGTSFFGHKGKVYKFVDDEISKRFKKGDKDSDFSDACERVTKRVLQALYTMHYKRANLIKTMPVPKS